MTRNQDPQPSANDSTYHNRLLIAMPQGPGSAVRPFTLAEATERSPGEVRILGRVVVSRRTPDHVTEYSLGNGSVSPYEAPVEPLEEHERETRRLGRAEEALLESNDALRLLSETANELLSSERPQEVINTLFEKLSARLGLEAYFNYLVDEDKGQLHLNSYAGIPPEVAREIEWLEYGQAVCGCVARDGCRIVAEDIQHSTDARTDLVRSFGIAAYVCHPLLAHDRVIGTFSFGTSRKAHFEPHELALMQAVCDQVSMAMERILLIAELRRREAAQRFLAEAGALLASSLDYEATLASFAQLVVARIVDWCAVDVVEPGGIVQRVSVAHRDPDKTALVGELEHCRALAPDQAQPSLRVMRTGEAEIYPELSDTSRGTVPLTAREQAIFAELGTRSVMIVPLLGRDGVLGAITFASAQSRRRFGPEDLALAKEVAYRVANSIDNARLYRQAREAVRMRDEFLSVAAHELKTPVTSLRGFAQATVRQFEKRKGFDEARVQRALQVIDQQSQKLSHLVSQLFDVSRMEAGQLALDRKMVEVGSLAKGVVDEMQAHSAQHSLVLRIHEPIWILADPLRLEQVLRNLLDNAIKFSPEGQRIDVEVWSPDLGTAKLAVRDRGVGIPSEHRDQLFGRFYQAHAADHSSGIGLGLYLSHHILELHEGEIEAQFPPDGGTRFVISLPTALQEIGRPWRERLPEYDGENTAC